MIAAAFGLGVSVSAAASSDVPGVDWTLHDTPVGAENSYWSSVTYGNGTFVAMGLAGGSDPQVMTSPDGATWTVQTAVAESNWQSVAYGGGQFVAVSRLGDNRVMTSADGATWTSQDPPSEPGSVIWESVTYGNGKFVSVATNAPLSTSTKKVMTSGEFIPNTPAAPTASAGDGQAAVSVISGSGNG